MCINVRMWNLEKWYKLTSSQGRSTDADAEGRQAGTREGGRAEGRALRHARYRGEPLSVGVGAGQRSLPSSAQLSALRRPRGWAEGCRSKRKEMHVCM